MIRPWRRCLPLSLEPPVSSPASVQFLCRLVSDYASNSLSFISCLAFSWESLYIREPSADKQGLAWHHAPNWRRYRGAGLSHSQANVSPREEAKQPEEEDQQEALTTAKAKSPSADWWLVRFSWFFALWQRRRLWLHCSPSWGRRDDPHAKCVFFQKRFVGTESFYYLRSQCI